MGRNHAKIMSRDAFITTFAQFEFIMRQNIASKIQDLIDKETKAGVKSGLQQAQEIVFGKVEKNDLG
jgi:hypothetical protein